LAKADRRPETYAPGEAFVTTRPQAIELEAELPNVSVLPDIAHNAHDLLGGNTLADCA